MSENEDENLPANIDQRTDESIDKIDSEYRSVDRVDMRQQKYINMKVFTSMTKKEVGQVLGVSASTMRKWDKDPDCIAFEKECQKKYQKETIDILAKQNVYLQNNIFMNLMERLGTPDPDNDLPADHTPEDRKRYMETFFSNMKAKDAFRAWEHIDKRTRMDSPESEIDLIEDNVFVSEVKRRRSRIERKRKAIEKLREEREQVEAEDEDGNPIDAQIETDEAAEESDDQEYEETVTETFEMEEYTIRSKGD